MKQSILKKPSTFREHFSEHGDETGDPSNKKLESESTKLLYEKNDKNLEKEAESIQNNTDVQLSTSSSKNVRFFGVDLVNSKY